MTDSLIDALFDYLDHWRQFPAYQLERRSDILFSLYLKDLLSANAHVKPITVLPEFPLHIGTLYKSDSNQSFRVDFLIPCEDNVTYLVELKTDLKSQGDEQKGHMKQAKLLGLPKLLHGLRAILQATKASGKYQNYLIELEKLGWINSLTSEDFQVTSPKQDLRLLYILPSDNDITRDDEIEYLFFEDVIKVLRTKQDDLSKRFSESLEKWQQQ